MPYLKVMLNYFRRRLHFMSKPHPYPTSKSRNIYGQDVCTGKIASVHFGQSTHLAISSQIDIDIVLGEPAASHRMQRWTLLRTH